MATLSSVGFSWRRAVAWMAALAILVASALVGQYAFSGIWAALLALIYVSFYRVAPRVEANRIQNNPFALGPFDLELRPDSYTVRVGETELNLALTEFGLAHDFETHYRLDHMSGIDLVVPKRALSGAEIEVIEIYRARSPGQPENTEIPAY